jgi:alkyl sulfatase BDS1-like metallo-beta-lactamase superfamily hydrolase
MGGADEVVRRARRSFADGDFRWVVQVVDHVLFADPHHAEARALQADALEQLGYGSENGTWRNFFLMGALELRHGSVGTPAATTAPDVLAALSLDQLFDSLAIRVDGPRCWDVDITVRFGLTDGEPVSLRLRNGVLTHVTGTGPLATDPDVEIALAERDLREVLVGAAEPAGLADREGVEVTGDIGRLTALLGHLVAPDPDFAIVTP